MKTSLSLSLFLLVLALPLEAEIRAAARGGVFTGADANPAGSLEVELRRGNWALSPAYEIVRGGYGQHAVHLDVRRIFPLTNRALWVGAGATRVATNEDAETTFNVDLGFKPWANRTWEPFVAARFYSYTIPVFRDKVDNSGAVLSIGLSRRLY